MNVLLTLTYSVFLNEPVNVALAVEHRCADLEERDTSAWTEVFEKVHTHAEVRLRLLVREPYFLNLCYCRLFHNLFALSLVYVVTAVPSVTSVGRIRVHVLVYGWGSEWPSRAPIAGHVGLLRPLLRSPLPTEFGILAEVLFFFFLPSRLYLLHLHIKHILSVLRAVRVRFAALFQRLQR